MKTKLTALFLILLLLNLFTASAKADNLLIGHSAIAPSGDYTVNWSWKACSMAAIQSGYVDYASIYIYESANGDVSWVVYDNPGIVGNIIVAGHGQLNFTGAGWYSFPVAPEYAGVQLIAGHQYFTSMMFPNGGAAKIGRGDSSYCGNIGNRKFVNQYPYGNYHNQIWPVAPGSKYVNNLTAGCYSLAIYSYGGQTPEKCYCECCGQEISCK